MATGDKFVDENRCGFRCLASAAERTFGGRTETGTKIRSALEATGVEFIDENGGGPGVRLRKRQPKNG